MKLALTAAAALAAALVLLSAASASPSRAAAQAPLLRIGITSPIPQLDVARGTVAGYIGYLGLETLMQIGPDGSVQPHLAQSVTQPGRAIYVYHLRHGIRFWDGNELTADDVANAMNYYRDPRFTTSTSYTSVKSIVAKDRYTVVVTLKHTDATWRLAAPVGFGGGIFEKAFQQAHGADMGKPGVLIMGTGPWRPVSLDPTSGAELVANDKYWGGTPPIQHVSFKFFADETSEALAFRAGEIDFAPFVGAARSFAAAANAPVVTRPSCNIAFFSMNTRLAPYNDVHVRRAISYAINRQELMSVYGPGATPLYTMIPPVHLRTIASKAQVDALLKSLPKYEFSIQKAKAELAKSAYPNGFTAEIHPLPFPPFPDITQVIVAQLAKIGINLKLTSVSIAAWLAEFISGDRNKVGPGFLDSGCSNNDPDTYARSFLYSKNAHGGAFNLSNYQSPAVDKLLLAGVAVTAPAKRFAIYSKLLRIVANDDPYVPLYLETSSYAIASSRFTWTGSSSPNVVDGPPWLLAVRPR
jgi:peptide/nickel transport system substrate-binding protein